MELKLADVRKQNELLRLLIVPYGIETRLGSVDQYWAYQLLIVPYGIETLKMNFISKNYENF